MWLTVNDSHYFRQSFMTPKLKYASGVNKIIKLIPVKVYDTLNFTLKPC